MLCTLVFLPYITLWQTRPLTAIACFWLWLLWNIENVFAPRWKLIFSGFLAGARGCIRSVILESRSESFMPQLINYSVWTLSFCWSFDTETLRIINTFKGLGVFLFLIFWCWSWRREDKCYLHEAGLKKRGGRKKPSTRLWSLHVMRLPLPFILDVCISSVKRRVVL